MTLTKTLAIAGFGLLLSLGATMDASAAPVPAGVHRMVKNDHRLTRENHRITRAERTGKITLVKAAMLHAKLRVLRHRELAHARLTLKTARHLRHAENRLGHQI